MFRWKAAAVVGSVLVASAIAAQADAASTITYTYDVFGQLVAVSSTAGRSVSYSYDAAGNRTNMSATGTTALKTPDTHLAQVVANQTIARPNQARTFASIEGEGFADGPQIRNRR